MEIQSSTLERLLEALDVRHLAGWYHPAMRLQGHLNVVQGSNAELRSQLKLLRYILQFTLLKYYYHGTMYFFFYN